MEVEVTVLDSRYADYASRLRAIFVAVAEYMGIRDGHIEAYIVANDCMEKNVLAYPAPADFPRPDLGTRRDYGELYINPRYIAEHGEDFAFMAVHGFLHLVGYDHHEKHDTVKMEAKEKEILTAIIHTIPHE